MVIRHQWKHLMLPLQWRDNECDGVSNYQPHDCLLNRRRSKRHQSSASLAFVRGIHRRPANSPHKGPVTRKMFPFDDVIMHFITSTQLHSIPWLSLDCLCDELYNTYIYITWRKMWNISCMKRLLAISYNISGLGKLISGKTQFDRLNKWNCENQKSVSKK